MDNADNSTTHRLVTMAPKKKVKLGKEDEAYITQPLQPHNIHLAYTAHLEHYEGGTGSQNSIRSMNIPQHHPIGSPDSSFHPHQYQEERFRSSPLPGPSHQYEIPEESATSQALHSNQSEKSSLPQPKRKQQCRKCANHDIDVDVRGHKHYCPYANCECDLCEVTSNRQHFMKIQQQITRKQKQERQQRREQQKQMHAEQVGHSADGVCFPQPLDMSMGIHDDLADREFPPIRRQEMERDLANIDDQNLLEKITELCRSHGGRRH